jgi:hypothetical protein
MPTPKEGTITFIDEVGGGAPASSEDPTVTFIDEVGGGQGTSRPILRGATVGAAENLGGIAELLSPVVGGKRILRKPGRGGPPQVVPGEPGGVSQQAGRVGQKAFEAITGEPDPGPATGGIDLIKERAAAEAVLGGLTAPIGGSATGAKLVSKGFQLLRRGIVEGTAAAVGGGASEAERQRGGGLLGQFVANMAGTFSALGLMRIVKGLGLGLGGGMAQILSSKYRARVADKLAPGMAQNLIQANKDEAIAALQLELNRITDPLRVGNPSPSQILGEFAPRIESLQASLAAKGTKEADILVLSLRKIREANKQAIEAHARRNLSPGAGRDADIAMQQFRAAAEGLKAKVNRLYNHPALQDNIEGVPTNLLKSQVAEIIKDAGVELDDKLPKNVMNIITDYDTTTDFQSLRRLQRRIGAEIRAVERESPETARYLTILDSAAVDTMDELAKATGTTRTLALQRAKDAAKQEKFLFGQFRRGKFGRTVIRERNPLTAAFLATDDSAKGFRNIWRSGKPAKNLRDLRTALDNSPDPDGAWAGVQQLAMDEVMGPNYGKLSKGDFSGARKALQGKEEAWDELFGRGAVENTREVLDRFEKISSGKLPIAKMGNLKEAAEKVGPAAAVVRSLVGFVRDVTFGRYVLAGGRLHTIGNGALPKTWDMAEVLMMKAFVDKSYLLDLLEQPTGRAITDFQKQTRAITRTGRAAAIEFQAHKPNVQQQEDTTGRP